MPSRPLPSDSSLLHIGRRAKPSADLVDHLLQCHERIRHFMRLAYAIAESPALAGAELAEACERCARYFTEALPLHVQDEEVSIAPRLEAESRLGITRRELGRQHAEHEPLVDALLLALRAVAAEPSSPAPREALARAAGELSSALEPHLLEEERLIFPALRALDPACLELIAREMRLRRAVR